MTTSCTKCGHVSTLAIEKAISKKKLKNFYKVKAKKGGYSNAKILDRGSKFHLFTNTGRKMSNTAIKQNL